MKVLYISSRLNVSDGSSVHGRAFFTSVQKLGYEIRSYPAIKPLSMPKTKSHIGKKGFLFYVKKLNPKSILARIKSLDFRIAIIINFLDGLRESFRDYFRLRAIVKEFQPDVIVSRNFLFNFAASWVSKMYGIPSIAEVNSLRSAELALKNDIQSWVKIIRWAEAYPLLRSSQIFCVSDAIKQKLDTFLDPDKVSVVPNGVDVDVFDRSRYDWRKIKEELGLKNKTVLGYVGSYKSWHGLRLSVDVVERLALDNPQFHLLLIGNGQEFKAIKQQINDKNLGSYVTQIEYVPHDEIPKYLAAIDIAVMTYPVFDGFYFSPLKMYEYMAMGIPVVSTDIGQIKDVIEDGKTGALVRQATVDQFVDAISSIAYDKSLLGKMGENARRDAKEKHSWLVNARQVIELCSRTLCSATEN